MTYGDFEVLVGNWRQSWSEAVAARAPEPSPGLLFSVCCEYPKEWCDRAMRLITRDMAGPSKMRNPCGLLYTAARDGWLNYFPEEPPRRCGRCGSGVLISQTEDRCAECTLREREAARVAAEAAEEAARRRAAEAAAAAEEARREHAEAVEEGRRLSDQLKAEFGLSRAGIIRMACKHGYEQMVVGGGWRDTALELVSQGLIRVPGTPDERSPTQRPAAASEPLRNWPDGPQPLGAVLGDVVSGLSEVSGPSAREPPEGDGQQRRESCPDRSESPERPEDGN
ncbi:MAG: hypothetical protein OXP08_08450 [bacterium]|nr:hypothetical protein [bacterium]